MQNYYETIMREVDGKILTIDLHGGTIIEDCKRIIVCLKEKLAELRIFVESHTFLDESAEIAFFKHHKPALLGRLLYFHEILCIEMRRPLDDKMLDGYYMRCQEEQKRVLMWMCVTLMTVRASPPDMTTLSPVL